jgi:hypothetical protein
MKGGFCVSKEFIPDPGSGCEKYSLYPGSQILLKKELCKKNQSFFVK